MAIAVITLITPTGCSKAPTIRPIQRPPPLAACDYIAVGPLNGWAVTINRDNSYTLLWGNAGISAYVPAQGSPLAFADIYALVAHIPFDAPWDDPTALQIILTSGAGNRLDQFAAATRSVEEIKVILESAQVGARPYWNYARPTLDELQWKYPLTMPAAQPRAPQ